MRVTTNRMPATYMYIDMCQQSSMFTYYVALPQQAHTIVSGH